MKKKHMEALVILQDRNMCICMCPNLLADPRACPGVYLFVFIPVEQDCFCDVLRLGNEVLVWWPLFSQIRSPH